MLPVTPLSRYRAFSAACHLQGWLWSHGSGTRWFLGSQLGSVKECSTRLVMSAVIINFGNSDSAGADILDSYPKSPAFVDEEVDSVSRLL